MGRIIRLTESDLIRLVKRVIKEQQEDVPSFLKERGYVLNNNLPSGKLSDTVRRLKEKYQMNDYYYNQQNEVQLITDNSKILFLVAPKNVSDLGPHDFEDVRQYL